MRVEEAWPLCLRNRAELYTISTSALYPQDPVMSPTKEIKTSMARVLKGSKEAIFLFSHTQSSLHQGRLSPQRCL